MHGEHDFLDDDAAGNHRPTLVHIEPGGGFEEPEGVISWLIAVARAHSLSPRVLLKYVIDKSPNQQDLWIGTSFFERDSRTINGYGKYAEALAGSITVHAQMDVESMTLLSLAGLFPHNGEGMLARYPKWCNSCLCEQARLGTRPHLKLVWYMEHYQVCHRHRQALSDRCPACGRRQAFIPIYPSIFHCSNCGQSMLSPRESDSEVLAPEPLAFDIWCADTLADLLARRNELKENGSLMVFRRNIVAIVAKLAPGNKKKLCESIGLQPYALNGWLNKDERPSLAVLLRVCYGVSIHVADAFLPNANVRASVRTAAVDVCGKRDARPILGLEQREAMRRLLQVIIDDPADCRPLAHVAAQLELNRSALKYWFRPECHEIVRKNRNFESRRMEIRYRADHDFLRAIVQQLRTDGIRPSRRRVGAELRRKGLALARPDLFLAFEQMTRTISPHLIRSRASD